MSAMDELEEFNDLPDFANDSNRELDRDLKDKERKLVVVDGEVTENEDRMKTMSEHLKNVQLELQNTQTLLVSKNKEIETEEHLMQIARREGGRVEAEIIKLDKQSAEVQEKINGVQNSVFQGNEKIDDFQMQMNWNKDELEQWTLAAKQKDEDNMALAKYAKVDESKQRDLALQIEKSQKDAQSLKETLVDEVTETQASQIQLDKTAEEFHNMHKDRQALVKQWEDAIEAIKRREGAIDMAEQRIQHLQAELRDRADRRAEKETMLNQQSADNTELEGRIAITERTVTRARSDHQANQQGYTDFTDEVNVLKNTLSKAGTDLGNQKRSNTAMTQEMDEKKKKLERQRKNQMATKKKLQTEFDNTEDLEKRAQQVDDMMLEANAKLKGAQRELADLKDQMYKRSQELFKQRQSEANLIAEISGAQSASKNLQSKIQSLDSQTVKQQELMYNADFQIQQMERKVSRASGERSAEEKKALTSQIDGLTQQLEDTKNGQAMLIKELRRLSDNVRATKLRVETGTKDEADVRQRLDELTLSNSSAMTELRKMTRSREETNVASDILQLEVERTKEKMGAFADEVFGLENRKGQLALSIEQRKVEIQSNFDLLAAQRKLAEEDRHRANLELQERLVKVEKLSAKFATIAGKLSGGGEGDEQMSQAYYVIKAAQEREELQREGDDLDRHIRKAEKEIRALANTLSHVTEKNTSFRKTFDKADSTSREFEQQKVLEKQYRSVVTRLQKDQQALTVQQKDLDQSSGALDEVQNMAASIEEDIGQKTNLDRTLQGDLEKQAIQLDRAQKNSIRNARELRHKRNLPVDQETPEETDLRLGLEKQKNRGAVQLLMQLTDQHPEMEQFLVASLNNNGIRLPPPAAGRPDSQRSFASSDGN